MELSSLDLNCVSLSDELTKSVVESSKSSSADTCNSTSTVVKSAKSKSPKGSPPSGVNALTRLTSQIKKPPHRKTSPVRWFPRKKGDSYLDRKIKLIQEAGGMNGTLDETLGHSNPHYCRVEREKIAAKEAARKVMNARKAAMVEASWCRILKAARISTKEAEDLLLKAEKEVTEAVEAATSKGVIMYNTTTPDRPWKHFEIRTSSVSGKGSATHTVKASFETAFEVDKQVAAAVKTAFIRLAHCSSFNRDEFKDLLRKISENPDTQELSESDSGSELKLANENESCGSQRKNRKKVNSPQKCNGTMLVDMMLERLKCLKEDELASLATIVATCGLNAALAYTENHNKAHDFFLNGPVMKQKQVEQELPGLEKFLVKKMTKLEREVLEARNARKAESKKGSEDDNRYKLDDKPVSGDDVPSLDKFLVKKLTRLEREVQEARNARKAESNKGSEGKKDESQPSNSADDVPDLGTAFVKSSSKFEKEVEEEKRNQNLGRMHKYGRRQDTEVPSLDQCLVKHVSRLEREVQEAKDRRSDEQTGKENVDSNGNRGGDVEHTEKENMQESGRWTYAKKSVKNRSDCGSLDEVLVKHVSRLEKAKIGLGKERLEVKKKDSTTHLNTDVGGLDQILVKHKSRLEREKTDASQQAENEVTYSMSRRQAREKELLDVWGGIGLGISVRPHVCRLEREKAAWLKAEEEEKRAVLQEQ